MTGQGPDLDSERPPEVIQLELPPTSSQALKHWHTTRHATRRHPPIQDRFGAPWQARFDWILDKPLSRPAHAPGEVVLTQRHERPQSIFCRAGHLQRFLNHVLPRLEAPVTLYVGNSDIPLSQQAGDASRLVPDPRIRAFFCENKDLDISDVRAMPIGLHPTDLLTGDGGRRLRALAARPGDVRRPTVCVLDRHQLAGEELRTHLGGGLFETPGTADLQDRWHRQAACRFSLVDWRRDTATFGVFETLALGSIPIVTTGPLSEAYEGLPVVRIPRLDEITAGNLDRWWRCLAASLADRRWLEPGYWWRHIVRTLPTSKRAILVVGPESHGTHLVTDLLVHAGCHGHSGMHESWRGGGETGRPDHQPWDERPPTDEDPIVWRRSVPHLRRWPDLRRMAADLEARGYGVEVVVVTRDRYAAVQSQLTRGHVTNESEAHANIERAFRHIFTQIDLADVRSTVVSYESLVHESGAPRRLLDRLALPANDTPFEIWDGNRKWHDAWVTATSATATRTDGSQTVAATASPESPFPEHWYPPLPETWVHESRRVLRGHQAMAEKRVVFCGLARNVAEHLPRVIANIEHAATSFFDFRVVVFENDSEDDTSEVLGAWARRNHRVAVVSERLGWPRWRQDESPARMAAMAEARNRVLDAVAQVRDIDHVVVLDLDLPKGFSPDGLATTFATDDWDVVGSNSLLVPAVGPPPPQAIYFDTWAFQPREDVSASPDDAPFFFERGQPWVPVVSSFGGLAVYTFAAFTCGARYAGPECEHVAFHRALRTRGFDRHFLNPSQIVLYSGAEPAEAKAVDP